MIRFSSSSLRVRLLLLVLLAVLPALGLILYTVSEHSRHAAHDVEENALRLIRLAALQQEGLIEGMRHRLIGLAHSPALRKRDPEGCGALFVQVLARFQRYTNLLVATPDGQVFCSGVPLPQPVDLSDRVYFQRALETRDFTLSGYPISRITGKPLLALAYPILDDSGVARGVIAAGLDLGWVNELVAEARLPDGFLARSLAGLVLVAVLGLVAAWVGGDLFILRRVKALLGATKRLAAGDLSARTGPPCGRGELGQPASAFDEMAVSLEQHVAERKRVEEALRESEARFRGLTETATDAIITTGADGHIRVFNSAAQRMFGYSAGEIVGHNIDVLIPEEYGDRHKAAMRRYLESGQSTILGKTVELTGRRKSGEVFLLELSVSVLRAGGEVIFTGIIRDITQRKQAEEKLRDEEARYRALFEQSPDGVAIIDPESTLPIEFNRTAHRQLGYSREEFAKLRVLDYEAIETSEETGAHIEKVLSKGRDDFETKHRAKEGELRDVLVSVQVITMSGRDVLHCVFRDITEQKRVHEEVQGQREALFQREKLAAMGELLAGVAHELNNPLSVVQGQAALLGQAVGEGPLAARAEKIASAADRCARIVKNFLALARQHPPERQGMGLNQVVQEAVELLAYQFRVDDVEVTLDLVTDLPVLWADPNQLAQVLVNLLTNAYQAMHHASPPHRLRITTRSDPARARVHLEVADTGPGIPPGIRSRIFEPFFTTKPPGEGTGLGLSVCQAIVREHGGAIRVESQPGHGATFRIELPVQAQPLVEPETRTTEALASIRGKTILVVEDEPDVADMLADILSSDDHQVDTAANGAIALEKLRKHDYDLIICDLKMPKLDGIGFYRELEHRYPKLLPRVIVLTGATMNPEITAFLQTTKLPLLKKPFLIDEVRQAVQTLLRASWDSSSSPGPR
ncbi:MAG: PAS domain S-box protein [Candidatus Methylomirabilia bacterium]